MKEINIKGGSLVELCIERDADITYSPTSGIPLDINPINQRVTIHLAKNGGIIKLELPTDKMFLDDCIREGISIDVEYTDKILTITSSGK